MAKRFTDPNKWKDEWFRGLPFGLRWLWLYLLDSCDFAGIWTVEKWLAEHYIGTPVPWPQIPVFFKDKIIASACNKYWFIPQYLTDQYGFDLSSGKALKAAVKVIHERGFTDDAVRIIGNSYHRVSIEYRYSIDTPTATAKAISRCSLVVKKDRVVGEEKKQDSSLQICKDFISAWNSNCGLLPKATFTEKRKTHITQRLKENPDIAYWQSVFQRVAASSFCNGTNDRGWRATIEFILRPDTHIKAMEGIYDNRPGKPEARVMNFA